MAKQASTAELENAMQAAQQRSAAPALDKREVAFRELHALFERSANELKKALPPHISPDYIARVTLTQCRKHPALLDCDKSSIIGAVFQAAELGLTPDTLGSCYLVPFQQQVQLIIGYKGYIDLIYRSPRVVSVQAHTVYANDHFSVKNGSKPVLEHEPADEPADEIKGFYAIAHLSNGGCLWRYMSRQQVEAHRDKHSSDYKYKKSKGKEGQSVWAQHFESMAHKTVLHQLTTWLPMSVQEKAFMALDGTVRRDITAEPEYIEAEAVEVTGAAD